MFKPCPDCLTWEAFSWSYLMTVSRAFGQNYCIWKSFRKMNCAKKDNERFGVTMYPLLDLVNHSPNRAIYHGQPMDVIRA